MSNPSDVIDEEEFEESQIDPNSPLKKPTKLAELQKINQPSNTTKPKVYQRPVVPAKPPSQPKPEVKHQNLNRANSDASTKEKPSSSSGSQRVPTAGAKNETSSSISESTKPGSATS